mmetsp:Transcript_17959/g.29119  ORF Transcript_17959/g.29119 Transcript_17959/m.29119 type:complete len:455 (-) Transcript_17959:398-1762(-)
MGVDRRIFRNLICVWCLQALGAVDSAVVIPSMADYVESLDGARRMYGYSIALFWIGRIIGLPCFGYMADYHSFFTCFMASLVIGVTGGITYGLAGMFKLVLLIPISRFILGLSSGVGSASMAYSATNVGDEQTRYIGFTQMVFNLVSAVSPIFNSLFVALPAISVGDREVVNSFSYCGYFIALCNLLVCALIVLYFTEEPTRCPAVSGDLLDDEQEFLIEELDRTGSDGSSPVEELLQNKPCLESVKGMLKLILRTGAWITFILSFQNNFNQTVVQWSLPLITQDLFGWKQSENGILFAGLGGVGFISTYFVANASRRGLTDRVIIVVFQCVVGAALILFTMYYGCSVGALSEPKFVAFLVIWGIGNFGQIPGNIGLYAKLVGSRKQGQVQAALFMTMSLARAISGNLIGTAYSTSGPCFLWTLVCIFWAGQFLFLIPMFPKLSPEAISKLHTR